MGHYSQLIDEKDLRGDSRNGHLESKMLMLACKAIGEYQYHLVKDKLCDIKCNGKFN